MTEEEEEQQPFYGNIVYIDLRPFYQPVDDPYWFDPEWFYSEWINEDGDVGFGIGARYGWRFLDFQGYEDLK